MEHLKDETPAEELSTEAVAAMLGVRVETIRRYRLSGELQSIPRMHGKRQIYFFSRAAVERFREMIQKR